MSSTKKVLCISPILGQGGTETSLINVASALRDEGCKVTFLIVNDKVETEPPKGVDVIYYFNTRLGSLRTKFLQEMLLRRYLKPLVCKNNGFDLVLSNYVTSRKIIDSLFPDKIWYFVHYDYQQRLRNARKVSVKKENRLMRKIGRYFGGKNCIGVSEAVANSLQAVCSPPPKRLKTIHNLFDIDKIKTLAREEVVELPSEPYIVHVARFDLEQKRQDVLFEALKLMSNPPRLALLTQPSDELSNLIKAHQCEDLVVVCGFKTNPYPWIRNASVLVLTSDYEGFGMVLVEALVCGTPIVSTDCPSGPSEIMIEELSEFLAPCREPQLIAEAIQRGIERGRTVNFEKHVQRFSSKTLSKKYFALMDD